MSLIAADFVKCLTLRIFPVSPAVGAAATDDGRGLRGRREYMAFGEPKTVFSTSLYVFKPIIAPIS